MTQHSEYVKLVVYRDYDKDAHVLPALLPLPESVAVLRRHVEAATQTSAKLLSYWNYATRRYELLERTAQLRQPAALLSSSSSSLSSASRSPPQQQQQQQQQQQGGHVTTSAAATTTAGAVVYRAQLWLETTLLTLEPVDADVEREEFAGLQAHVRRWANGHDNDDDNNSKGDDDGAQVRYELVHATRVRCDYFARLFDAVRSEQLGRVLPTSQQQQQQQQQNSRNRAVQLLFYSNNAWSVTEVLRCGFVLCARPPSWLLAASVDVPSSEGAVDAAATTTHGVDSDTRQAWADTLRTPFVFTSCVTHTATTRQQQRCRVLLCEVAPGRAYVSQSPLLPLSSSSPPPSTPPPGYDSVLHMHKSTAASAAVRRVLQLRVGHSYQALPRYVLVLERRRMTAPQPPTPHRRLLSRSRSKHDDNSDSDDESDDSDGSHARWQQQQRQQQRRLRRRRTARAATATPPRRSQSARTPSRNGGSALRARIQHEQQQPLLPPTPSPVVKRLTREEEDNDDSANNNNNNKTKSNNNSTTMTTSGAVMLLEAAPPAAAATTRQQQQQQQQQSSLLSSHRQVTWQAANNKNSAAGADDVTAVRVTPQQRQRTRASSVGSTRSHDGSRAGSILSYDETDAVDDDDDDGNDNSSRRSRRRHRRRRVSVRRRTPRRRPHSRASSVRSRHSHLSEKDATTTAMAAAAAASVSTAVPETLLCSIHTRRATTLYCHTCDELICAHCASIGVHSGHAVDSADARAVQLLSTLQTTCHRLATAVDAHARAQEQLTLQRADAQRRRQQRHASLRLRIAELHRALDARAQTLQRELRCSSRGGGRNKDDSVVSGSNVNDNDDDEEAVAVVTVTGGNNGSGSGSSNAPLSSLTTTTTLAATEAAVARARRQLQAALLPLERAVHTYHDSRRLTQSTLASSQAHHKARSHAGSDDDDDDDDADDKSSTRRRRAAAHRARTTATLLFVKQAPRLLAKAQAVMTQQQMSPQLPHRTASSCDGEDKDNATTTTVALAAVAADEDVLTRVQRVVDAVRAAQQRADEQLARIDVTELRHTVESLGRDTRSNSNSNNNSMHGAGAAGAAAAAAHTPPSRALVVHSSSSSPLQLQQQQHDVKGNHTTTTRPRAGGAADEAQSLSDAWQAVRRLERNLADLQRGHLWSVQRATYYFAPSQHRTVCSTPFCLLGVEWEVRIAPAHAMAAAGAAGVADNNKKKTTTASSSSSAADNDEGEEQWLGLYLCPRSHRMRLDFRLIAFSDVAWHAWEVRGWSEAYAGRPWGVYPLLQRKELMRTDKLARNDTVKLCVSPMTGLY